MLYQLVAVLISEQSRENSVYSAVCTLDLDILCSKLTYYAMLLCSKNHTIMLPSPGHYAHIMLMYKLTFDLVV